MRTYQKKSLWLVLLAVLIVVLAGCSTNQAQQTGANSTAETQSTAASLALAHPPSNSTVAVSTEPLGAFSLDEIGASNIVDVNFVESKIGDPNWIIIDGREKKDYDKGHIPGAVNFPKSIVKTLKDPMDGRVLPGDRMAKLLGEIGVSNDKKVIIYGKAGDYHVLAEMGPLYFGLSEWDYLDSGYEGWVKAGKKVETTPVKPVPAVFEAKVVNPNMYVSTYQMAEIVKSKDPKYYLIDVRSKDEFNGQGFGGIRAGRIPGANSYPVDINLDKNTKALLPIEKLAEIYKDVPKDKTVILYCHRGCRTGFAFLALRAMGYKDVRVYEDGFVVWNAWMELPVDEEHFLNLRGDLKTTVEKVKLMDTPSAAH